MNCTTFFPETMFHQLRQDVSSKKVVSITNSPYRKKIKVNGNTYELSISTGHYLVSGEYYVSGWVDHAYTNLYGHRDIGGGNYLKVVLDSYQSFKDAVNAILSRYPDYKEEAFEPYQMAWF